MTKGYFYEKYETSSAPLLLCSSVALAADNEQSKGFYVQADLGYAWEKLINDSDNAKYKNKALHPRFSLGYDFGQWRLAFDYSRYKPLRKDAHSSTPPNPIFKTEYNTHNKVKSETFGIAAIYDFETKSPIKPYIGARLSVNHITIDFSDDGYIANKTSSSVPSQILPPGFPSLGPNQTVNFATTTNHISLTRVGVGAIVGVSYEITKNLALDLAYHYDDWGKLEKNKIRTYEVSTGLRFTF
ncbi:Outer membrane protein P.IIC precursor [Haemophilus influenzae]|uniref:opacity family porin n=1 Tax=Haemophilus influenzae TaxID=727 RepID=UPI000D4111A0|nr:opacity family porin [Haemophilus influenzae]PRI66141.1 Outer membrane protein P.IIC precursor [Haemophilus influenzae]